MVKMYRVAKKAQKELITRAMLGGGGGGKKGTSLAGMGGRDGCVAVFKGKRERRLLMVERRRGARGEDQSTGDDFITTRHSSTTLKYQKSGGLIQVRESARRGARHGSPCASFLHNAFLVSPLKRKEKRLDVGWKEQDGRREGKRLACNPRRPDSAAAIALRFFFPFFFRPVGKNIISSTRCLLSK